MSAHERSSYRGGLKKTQPAPFLSFFFFFLAERAAALAN
jgi:hypothetical protein